MQKENRKARKFRFLDVFYGITFIPALFIFLNYFCYSKPGEEKVSQKKVSTDTILYYGVRALKISDDLTFAGDNVPVERFDVRESLDRELLVNTYWHSNTFQSIKRANRYFPVIERILKKNGLPDDLKYIAVAESNLKNAVSPAGARGIWQFMESTAQSYGLEVNYFVDERYHVVKATEAACEYFKDCYKRYKDWALVAAAYNAGQGRINSELEQQKVDSYYDLLLNPETARYVYRVIAIKLVMSDPKAFGFNFEEDDLYPVIPTYKIKVDTEIDNLVYFAHKYSINYKILKLLNPWLRRSELPNKSGKTYYIEVPKHLVTTIDFKPVKAASDTMEIEKEIIKE